MRQGDSSIAEFDEALREESLRIFSHCRSGNDKEDTALKRRLEEQKIHAFSRGLRDKDIEQTIFTSMSEVKGPYHYDAVVAHAAAMFGSRWHNKPEYQRGLPRRVSAHRQTAPTLNPPRVINFALIPSDPRDRNNRSVCKNFWQGFCRGGCNRSHEEWVEHNRPDTPKGTYKRTSSRD